MTGERIVPDVDSNVAISGIPELQAHLQQLVDDPSTAINAKLLDDVELQLTEANIPSLLPSLLPPLTTILKTTPHDPTPLLSLSIKLLSPLPFGAALQVADPPSLLAALRSPIPGANLLALAIVHKAARSPADAALLSALPEVVREVLRRWLESQDTGVGENAARVLEDLLRTDSAVVEGARDGGGDGVNGVNGTEVVRRRREPGQGRLWRLIFLDGDSVAIIPTLCTPNSNSDPPRPLRAVTISQGRLLRLLPRLATIDIHPLADTPFPDLFPISASTSSSNSGSDAPKPGLLPWAAFSMVDTSDILMHLNLIDFFETFVSVMRVSEHRSRERDGVVRSLVRTAVRGDQRLRESLTSLPDRTVEEEAEPLRMYIREILD